MRARATALALESSCLGTRAARFQRLVARHFALALRAQGLSIPQMEVLSVLTLSDEPLKPSEIAERLAIERSTISRNLTLMVENAWVAAAHTSPGMRAMSVAITSTGSAKLAAAHSAWRAAQAELVGLLGADAVSTLDQWLTRLQGVTGTG